MKYKFELSSRTDLNISVEQKHEKIINGLKQILSPWGIKDGSYPAPEFGDAIIAVFNFDKILGKTLSGNIIYRFRRMLENHSLDDDVINIEFNPKKLDYAFLIEDVFKKYIDFFEPYSAHIFDEELIYQDFERSQNKNLRKDLIRFYPVSFFDAKYCMDALGVSLLELKNLLLEKVERVELYKDGIIIIASSKLLNSEQSNKMDENLRRLVNLNH
jgi:hypothetical protein